MNTTVKESGNEQALVLQRLSRTTLQDQVYLEIKDAIMSGRFAPGHILVIRQIAEEMGTSIMPVRDALQRLASERALQVLPNRSVQVSKLSLAEFEIITAIRLRLESLAAERACPLLTEADITSLSELDLEMVAGIAALDPGRVLRANKAFHMTIYRAAGSDLLLSYIEALWLRIGPLLITPWRVAAADVMFNKAHDTHQLILSALKSRDSAAAGKTLCLDISYAADWYRQHMVSFFDP